MGQERIPLGLQRLVVVVVVVVTVPWQPAQLLLLMPTKLDAPEGCRKRGRNDLVRLHPSKSRAWARPMCEPGAMPAHSEVVAERLAPAPAFCGGGWHPMHRGGCCSTLRGDHAGRHTQQPLVGQWWQTQRRQQRVVQLRQVLHRVHPQGPQRSLVLPKPQP